MAPMAPYLAHQKLVTIFGGIYRSIFVAPKYSIIHGQIVVDSG